MSVKKRALKIFFWVLTILFLLLITPVILLNINSVQNFVVQKITQSLSETLQTEVKVGHVDLRGFNRLKVNDLYIADLSGDTLLNAQNIEGKFSVLKLFGKKLAIHYVLLENADIHLVTDTTGTLNAEFLKILFEKKDDNKKTMALTFEIDDIKIKNCNFSYKNQTKNSTETANKINFADIFLTEINSQISLDKIAEKYFAGSVKSLCFNEKSGFKVKDFQTTFLFNDSTCRVTQTKLLMPNSQILLDSIVLTYSDLETFQTNFEKTGISAGMFSAKIQGKDFAAFSPIFSGLTNDITIALSTYGTVEDLIIKRLDINYGKDIGFSGTCQASGLPDLQHTYVLASIDDLHGSAIGIQNLIAGITHKPFLLSKEMQNLRKLSYKGKISGYMGNLALLGTLYSNIGSIKTDLTIRTHNNFQDMIVEGKIKTSGIDLATIMPSESGFGKIILDAEATVKAGKNVNFESRVNAKIHSFLFHNYNYNNLILNGNISKNTFEGNASIDDENGKLNFHGNVVLDKENSKFHFKANVNDFKPHKLNLIKNYPKLELNFGLNANFEGNKIEKIKGDIVFEPITVENNGTFTLKKLSIASKPQNDSLMTTIESDLINGYLSGTYSPATLPADFINTLANYMPILKEKSAKNNLGKNNIGFYFEIEPLQKLCDVLDINFTTTKKTTLSGFYNSDIKRFNAEIDMPQSKNNATIFNGTNLHCYNNEKDIKLYFSTLALLKNDSVELRFNTNFANDSIRSLIIWNNFDEKSIFAGELYAQTKIFEEKDTLMLNTNILPTQIVVKNNVLDIKKSNILTNFNWIDIKNFTVSGNEQNIILNGRASKFEEDKISVILDNFHLDFVNNFISTTSPLAFGGLVTGNATISRVFKKPILDAKLKVPNFTFNDALIGVANVTSEFDHDRNCLAFNGIITSKHSDLPTTINGAFFFANDSLDIKGTAQRLNLGFLKKITKNIFDDLGGLASGEVHLIKRKRRFSVETAAKVDNGHLKIGFLNADLYFNDSIFLKKDSILFRKINIFDAEKNKGTVDGYVAHRNMRRFKYKLNLQCNKMLLFNAEKGGYSPFYGKAYATGSGSIYGNQEQTNIVCNVTSDPNTRITIPLDGASVASSNNFITFVSQKQLPVEPPPTTTRSRSRRNYDDEDEKSNIMVDLTLNVNPNAEIQLFLDSRAGDMLRARGEGLLRLNYNGKTEDFTMNGKYNLIEGDYLFTFQDVLNKKFKITEGSSVLFAGSPSNPTVDIKAVYQTSAALSGIFDPEIVSQANRKKALVNCLLNITGNLLKPVISFDLTLPNSDEELNRTLKNVVNTDEIMNREIIYLLVLGMFYNPNEMKNSTSTTQTEVLNVVTSTLSQQLNSMASQLFDKVNVGLIVNIDNEKDLKENKSNEYGLTFDYTPNDKLTITGNVGYKDGQNATAQQNPNSWSNYILDFEIEYKLIQSGKLSAKAYNRTNNYNEFKDAPYTQGVGIVYRENFNSLAELAANWKKNRKQSKENKQKKKEEKKNKKEEKE